MKKRKLSLNELEAWLLTRLRLEGKRNRRKTVSQDLLAREDTINGTSIEGMIIDGTMIGGREEEARHPTTNENGTIVTLPLQITSDTTVTMRGIMIRKRGRTDIVTEVAAKSGEEESLIDKDEIVVNAISVEVENVKAETGTDSSGRIER